MQGQNGDDENLEGGKRSAWLAHVKKTMRKHKGLPLKKVLQEAARSYEGKTRKTRKTRRGGTYHMGGAALSPLPYNGGARKGSRKGSRRH